MSCKIRIDRNNKKAGKLCYLLMTTDAASLEARVAVSDTVLNEEGIDPTLFSIYDPKSGLGEDMHSLTAHAIFCKSINMQINEAVDENGKTWIYLDNQDMHIRRNGKECKVVGSRILETDEILGYVS